MSFFDTFRGKKKTESVILIDIDTGSVAGAYAQFTEGEQPAMLYTRRLPIEVREGEPHENAMLRALGILGNTLIQEGAPVLLRSTGSGSAKTVVVSVDAPWQKTSVRTEYFEQITPFIFTKAFVKEALRETSVAPDGQLVADESITGTILNGYETKDPYGKEARRASVIILTSLINERVANGMYTALRGLFHTRNILSISGSSLRYQALRIAFPHERDALILDATGSISTIALVRRDLLVDVLEVPSHRVGTAVWLKALMSELAALAQRFPLPRTIFLLAREADTTSLREMLGGENVRALWLSEHPPRIVSVQGTHISEFVRQVTTASPDLSLLLMALYFQHRQPEE